MAGGSKNGVSNNPVGRPKGVGNRSTERAKRVLAEFVGKNLDTMQELFEEIKRENPKQAFDVLFSSLEYMIPKLARVEQQQLDAKGEPTDPVKEILTFIEQSDNNDLPNKKD